MNYVARTSATQVTGNTLKVSAIITTYNDDKFKLQTSIRSILNQDDKLHQVLIIDDGSMIPFGGLNAQDYPECQFIENNSNIGVAKSRNKAVTFATGDYIAFLDCGDVWLPSKIKLQKQIALKCPECVLIFSGAVFTDHEAYFEAIKPVFTNDWTLALLLGQPITGSISNSLIKKNIFEIVGGFHAKSDIPEDRDLWLRLSKIGKFSFSEAVTAEIEIVEGSRSNDLDRTTRSYRHFIDLHRSEYIKYNILQYAYKLMYISLANKAFTNKRILDGYKFLLLALSWKTLPRCCKIAIIAAVSYMSKSNFRTVKVRFKKFINGAKSV